MNIVCTHEHLELSVEQMELLQLITLKTPEFIMVKKKIHLAYPLRYVRVLPVNVRIIT